MGKKYIIELEDNESVYKTIIANGYPMIQVIVPAPYAEPDMEQVKKEAYKEGREAGIKDGMCEAWEAARTLWNTVKRKEIFGYTVFNTALMALTGQEAIDKIRQYKQEKEEQIQVGDEVIPRETEYDTMIVTRLWKDDYDSDCIDAIGFDGRISSFLVSRVSKTGKHCEIAEVLQKMKES